MRRELKHIVQEGETQIHEIFKYGVLLGTHLHALLTYYHSYCSATSQSLLSFHHVILKWFQAHHKFHKHHTTGLRLPQAFSKVVFTHRKPYSKMVSRSP